MGNILQYCSSLIKEVDRTFKDLPILDYFTNPDQFPQPGSNEIEYAAQRLRGVVRKDVHQPLTNATKTEIFWSIKCFLEKSVTNHREHEFVEFVVTAVCSEEQIGDHIVLLRRFVVHEIFMEYFIAARENPEIGNPVWSYILPCLSAVRSIYSTVWGSLVADDLRELKVFAEDLIALMVSLYEIMQIIHGQTSYGGLYSVVGARILDISILVAHTAYFIRDWVSDDAQIMERILNSFCLLKNGEDSHMDEIYWRNNVSGNEYMRGMVRRELRPIVHDSILGISAEKIGDMWNELTGKPKEVMGDDVIIMYM